MQVTEVARGRFPHIPVCEIVCLRLCLCDFILFFVCVCVHKPVLLQAKNIAMLLCLCVLREREWRKRPSQSTWAGIKVLTREKEWVRDGGREKESERGDRIQAKGGQNREEREASPGGHWVSGSPLLLSHSTFHSNNLTSQPGSRKNEKKYSGGGGSPPQTGIETLEEELLCSVDLVWASTSQRPRNKIIQILLDSLQWHLQEELCVFQSFVKTSGALKWWQIVLTSY